MKRLSPLLVALIFTIVTVLSGCSGGEINRSEELKGVYETALENLENSFQGETCDYDLVTEYLESWSEGSGVKVEKAAEHYTSLLNPATDKGSAKNTTILQCSIHTDDIKSDFKALAMGLACLLGPNEHDNIRLIVTEMDEGLRVGADDIDAKLLKCTDFINLSSSSNYSLSVSGSETATATIKTKAETNAPHYGQAFEITMNFDKYADPYRFDKKNNYPDPITTIGNLLANAKSSGKLFEIASFTSESVEGYMPHKVTAVIVVDGNSVESITNKFDKSFNSIEDRFNKIETDFVYTMTETKMPSKVLSDEAANGLISLMYTMSSGIYDQDEETGIINSASYFKSIDTKDDLTVTVDMRARSAEALETLSSDFEITSGLCNMKYTISKAHPVWTSSEESDLASYFSNIVPQAEDESNIMLASSELDIFAKKNPNLNAISLNFVKDVSKKTLSNIINYMDRSKSE